MYGKSESSDNGVLDVFNRLVKRMIINIKFKKMLHMYAVTGLLHDVVY